MKNEFGFIFISGVCLPIGFRRVIFNCVICVCDCIYCHVCVTVFITSKYTCTRVGLDVDLVEGREHG